MHSEDSSRLSSLSSLTSRFAQLNFVDGGEHCFGPVRRQLQQTFITTSTIVDNHGEWPPWVDGNIFLTRVFPANGAKHHVIPHRQHLWRSGYLDKLVDRNDAFLGVSLFDEEHRVSLSDASKIEKTPVLRGRIRAKTRRLCVSNKTPEQSTDLHQILPPFQVQRGIL
jgi:hypothetical protein